MQYHAQAALTQTQRRRVQQLSRDGWSQAALARQFGVSRSTIQRWIARTDTADRSSAPRQHGHQVVTDTYRQAVLAARTAQPHHGPKRIAHALRERFPSANSATVWRILHAAGVSRRAPKKTEQPADPARSPSGATRHPGTAGDSGRAQT